MRRSIFGLFVLVLALAVAGPAHAVVYKNPAQTYKEGNKVFGVSYQSMDRDVEGEGGGEAVGLDYTIAAAQFGFALGGKGLLEFRVGQASGELDVPGSETNSGFTYGAEYRHNLSQGSGLQQGLLISYQFANIEDDYDNELDVYDTNVGYGVSFGLSSTLSAYAGGVFTIFEGTAYGAGGGASDFEGADDPLGAFAGIEMDSGQFKFGFELHLLHENGFGFYFDATL